MDQSEADERIEIGDGDDGDHHHKQPLLVRRRTNASSQLAIVGANKSPIQSLDYESVFHFPLFSFLTKSKSLF